MIRRADTREAIVAAWPAVAPIIRPTIERSRGFHSAETVFAALMAGDLQLWTAGDPVEMACLTEIRVAPTKKVKVLNLFAAGGRNLYAHLEEGVRTIEDWARSQGCTRGRIEGRREWRVIAGYRQTSAILEKDL